jgi:hypothetical protein
MKCIDAPENFTRETMSVIFCAGCGKETTLHGPVCDDCLGIGIERSPSPDCCSLCLARGLTLRGGLHYNKKGGYAGKCSG